MTVLLLAKGLWKLELEFPDCSRRWELGDEAGVIVLLLVAETAARRDDDVEVEPEVGNVCRVHARRAGPAVPAVGRISRVAE